MEIKKGEFKSKYSYLFSFVDMIPRSSIIYSLLKTFQCLCNFPVNNNVFRHSIFSTILSLHKSWWYYAQWVPNFCLFNWKISVYHILDIDCKGSFSHNLLLSGQTCPLSLFRSIMTVIIFYISFDTKMSPKLVFFHELMGWFHLQKKFIFLLSFRPLRPRLKKATLSVFELLINDKIANFIVTLSTKWT